MEKNLDIEIKIIIKITNKTLMRATSTLFIAMLKAFLSVH
jgi:hypothetical protein